MQAKHPNTYNEGKTFVSGESQLAGTYSPPGGKELPPVWGLGAGITSWNIAPTFWSTNSDLWCVGRKKIDRLLVELYSCLEATCYCSHTYPDTVTVQMSKQFPGESF